MQNRIFTYSFLLVMVLALVTLAVLQYRWLGSVSEAERERLEQGLDASIENFISDFNEVFSNTGEVFRIQVTSSTPDYERLLGEAYSTWFTTSTYQDLVDSVYLLKSEEGFSNEIYTLNTDPIRLERINPDQNLKSWIAENENDGNVNTTPLRVHPDLGNPTYMSVPIQFLDMIKVHKEEINKNIEIRLSVDQLDDVVLIKLDDQFIKEKLIPELAGTYFSSSYDDQYVLSIVRNADEPDFYFTNGETDNIPEPEFLSAIDRFDFKSLMLFTGKDHDFESFRFPEKVDSLEINIRETEPIKRIPDSGSFSVSHLTSSFVSENVSSVTLQNFDSTSIRRSWTTSASIDTMVTSSLIGSMVGSNWQFWLSFKEGSLDKFVSKTRNRNLAISFGILGILGISVVLIVIFAQRSRELAEQQMLFVAGVSHELRTPITVIRSAAENLSEGVVSTEQRKKEYARLMLKEGRRLSDMVDQIMEFSGIQTGKRVYNFTDVELPAIMDELLAEFEPILGEVGVQLEFSNTSNTNHLKADKEALYLSLSNLLNNAIKFRGNSDKIRFSIAETSKQDFLTFTVQDYGIGIPFEEQKQIFQPFFRGKQPVENQVKGNGIGLSLVKKVAEAHHGEVHMKSEPGKGSVFTLTIPIHHE